jgi:hypothetical protein
VILRPALPTLHGLLSHSFGTSQVVLCTDIVDVMLVFTVYNRVRFHVHAGPNSVRPDGLSELFKQGNIVTSIGSGSQTFPQNIYHYFELLVKVTPLICDWGMRKISDYFSWIQGGDDLQAADSRRDLVYYSLVSPDSMQVGVGRADFIWKKVLTEIDVFAQVSKGQIVPSTQNSAKKPAYDFYVGQDCIPTVCFVFCFQIDPCDKVQCSDWEGLKIK